MPIYRYATHLQEHAVVKAIWNESVIAESDDTVVVEGNHYFPLGSVRAASLRPSATTSRCPWKGTANYHSIEIDGKTNQDAAWYYADPLPAASNIKGRIAFWKGVTVR
ncbi:hypothetical protein AA700_0883 [Acidiphilium acidophilum DSM 700]|uniref:DUF427 domain-containing protein n=1 Tax=Acidiphilium acidophilum TaxID=76588 RepID=A0AAW9DP79_ACIAO|nr:DUF427 domain-containing protein [Acidiphilium acidophilum]GBQ07702.1 hypothetical protein AA700_0883 [Acidiphilium acidophilum DSM 700]